MTRVILFVVALIGAYVAISGQADGGVTPAGAAGVGAFLSLMGWATFGAGNFPTRNDELLKQPREGDRENPTR